jgi:crotonobetainyl-CoA:carnitine CoA-transferase CaiB-like acyl-CoA transferase
MLGEWGAEVIKIEQPPARNGRGPRMRIEPAGLAFDRGKKSISLNLKHPEGKAIAMKLVASADVVGENMRLGTMERLGFGYEDLKAVNPRIVYLSGRGFGSRGPRANDPAMDPAAQAMGGIMNLTGELGGYPFVVGYAVVDYMAAMHGAMGIMVALFDRERTGVGQQVETSLLGTAIHSQIWGTYMSWMEGKSRVRQGRRFAAAGNPPEGGLANTFRTSDGYLLLQTPLSDRRWPSFCEALGRDDLLTDERFETESARQKHIPDIEKIMDDEFATKTSDEWVALLSRSGEQVVAPVLDHDQIRHHPQVRANDYVVDVEHPLLGTISAVGHPLRFSAFDVDIPAAAPQVGGDTEAVLESMGYTSADIERLRQEEVI